VYTVFASYSSSYTISIHISLPLVAIPSHSPQNVPSFLFSNFVEEKEGKNDSFAYLR
jgi:hypothetical protein